jgi:hypothetical protein
MIEFPETLEELTVWKLEQVDSRSTFRSFLYRTVRAPHDHATIDHQMTAWLHRMHALEGIVMITKAPPFALGPDFSYEISVAGVHVKYLSLVAAEAFGVTHVHD